MYDTSKAAGKTLPAGSINSMPHWSGIAPRLLLVVATGCGAVVLLAAVLIGDHYAARAVATHERLIGNDLVQSVDRILNSVRSRRGPELAALAGRSCERVRRSLTELQTYVRYVRAVALTANDRVYCSSGLGQIDVPLSDYLTSTAAAASINLLPQTPFQPGVPVLAMFEASSKDTGVLYIIEGDYIADTLAHGVRYGAQNAALSIGGVGLLTDNGAFVSHSRSPFFYATRVSSDVWPFSITLSYCLEPSAYCWTYSSPPPICWRLRHAACS
jgi:hypothetical protein